MIHVQNPILHLTIIPCFIFERDGCERYCPTAKKCKHYVGHYQDDWKRVFNGVIAPSKLGDHHAWWLVCSSCDVNNLCQKKLCFVCYCIWAYACLTAGSYAKIVLCNGIDNLYGFLYRLYGFFVMILRI